MSVDALITDGRRLAEELMIDTATISRPSSTAPTLDPDTGILTPAAGTAIHSGPCRVKAPTAQEQVEIFGDTAVTTSRFVASFPHDIPVVLKGDVVTVTASEDARLLTRPLRVVAIEMKSVLHSRRLGVETVE